MNVMSSKSGVFAVQEQEKGQSEGVPVVTEGIRIKDCRFCGRSHERRNCPAFGQISAYSKKKNHFVAKCPAKSKVSAVQERFYRSAAGVSGGREMVTLTVFKDDKSATGYEIPFVMDTGAECNLLPVDVYKQVSGDQHLNFLYARGKSAFILPNGEEHRIEGKATLFVSRQGRKHQIEVNVVKGSGYEPIL